MHQVGFSIHNYIEMHGERNIKKEINIQKTSSEYWQNPIYICENCFMYNNSEYLDWHA